VNDIELILKKYPGSRRDSLIPILQEVQEARGYLSREAIILIGRHLDLPASKIYGVATFYNQFRFQPKGKYHFMVCRGTACHVKGSLDLLETAKRLIGIDVGETTKDGLFSLETVACLGGCSIAPVITANGKFFGRLDKKKLEELIEGFRAAGRVEE
jgi:NADH-quinone oxidoreductase subunit E